MSAASRRMFSMVPILLAWVFLVSSVLHAQPVQDTTQPIPDTTYRPPTSGQVRSTPNLDELQSIKFVGCAETSSEELIGVIQSRESELSFTRRMAVYYYENLKRNPATPDQASITLAKVQKELEDELRYFNAYDALEDSIALTTYLYQNGYHNATVNWSFGYDTSAYKNTLTFYIVENPRAVIDTIIYLGLADIPPDVRSEVAKVMLLHKGDPFSESSFEVEIQRMVETLQDFGYYRAAYERPVISVSENGLHDSLLAVIRPGPRVRVQQIVFEENLNSYPSVNESTRRRQLEFEEGEWYSRRAILRSRSNLIGLGAFELAAIDTIEAVMMDSANKPMGAGYIALKVFTKNAKVYDVGANLLMFQTAVDNYLNVGVGITAQYRNVFGGAQVASITFQYILQDVSRAFQGQPLETEALSSLVLAWPNLARFGEVRVGLQTNVYYSMRLLVYPFRLESFGFGGRAPMSLYSHTYFNGLDLNIGIERQVPRNFEGALDDALEEANSPEDSAYVYSTFNQFLILDSYLKTSGNFFTGLFFGTNIRGEHRDNPVDPRRGNFTSISGEIGLGAGQFLRGQLFNTVVVPFSERFGIATKVKLGHIWLFGFERGSEIDTNTYVPLERQFFAGGAASIRSFPSRMLHDPHSGTIVTLVPSDPVILANTVGSATLVEIGLEFRYRFARPRGLDALWASIIERSGITVFFDAGNTFNRMTVDLYGTMTLNDLFVGSALASGLGYRFETPVGPFRIDYATSLYDPTRVDGQWIFDGRTNVLGFDNWQLSIGLGHAF